MKVIWNYEGFFLLLLLLATVTATQSTYKSWQSLETFYPLRVFTALLFIPSAQTLKLEFSQGRPFTSISSSHWTNPCPTGQKHLLILLLLLRWNDLGLLGVGKMLTKPFEEFCFVLFCLFSLNIQLQEIKSPRGDGRPQSQQVHLELFFLCVELLHFNCLAHGCSISHWLFYLMIVMRLIWNESHVPLCWSLFVTLSCSYCLNRSEQARKHIAALNSFKLHFHGLGFVTTKSILFVLS